nr:B-lymphocyte antigen CD19 [Zootoca vivipara]
MDWCASGAGCREAMVSALRYLFLLRLGWLGAATGVPGELTNVQATETQAVLLPCTFNHTLASDDLNLTWLGPSGKELSYVHVKYNHSEVNLGEKWSLFIYNISRQYGMWFTCSWNGISGKKHTLTWTGDDDGGGDKDPEDIEEEVKDSKRDAGSGSNSTFYSPLAWRQADSPHPANGMESFPCDAPIPRNWTNGTLLWIQHDSMGKKTVLVTVALWRSITNHLLLMRTNGIILVLPSVTPADSGNYTCQWKDQALHFQLEVAAKPAAWLQLGAQHWIIWTVALVHMIACLGCLFCFLRLRRAIRVRRQMKLRGPVRRRYFCAKRNRPHASNGVLVVPSANEDVREQVDAFSYENVLPDAGPRRGCQLLQKGKILPNTTNMEDEDEEEYEHPDSETELKSDDDDNYENTQEEVKRGDAALNGVSLYENRKDETKSGSQKWGSADPLYANNTQQSVKNLVKDPLAEDSENYENLEEELSVSPGAARLIAGLRRQLALDPYVDKQDGCSEASTGSQSYEEMNGSLCPTSSKLLHLPTNISNEEDADSYENMESPNSVSSRKEGNMDSCGEGTAFGIPRQHHSIPFGVDLRGGMLCSD